MAICNGKNIQGKEISPQSIGKVKRGNYYVPDCPDYKPRIDIPIKVKTDEVLTGWHCCNCKNFKQTPRKIKKERKVI